MRLKRVLSKRNYVVLQVFGLLLLAGIVALAQKPKDNISAARHPNLAAAQDLCTRAWERISEAQKANEFDMQGHAQKAKELLDQVNRELRMAATAANEKGK